MGDPFWLTMEQIGRLTDRQIREVYLHPRRMQKAGDSTRPDTSPYERQPRNFDTNASPQPGGPIRDDLEFDGKPVSEEGALMALVSMGFMKREDVDRVIAEKEAFYKAQQQEPASD